MNKLLFVCILFGALASGVYAENRTTEEITPYGAYCPLCGEYGYCIKQPTKKEIINALNLYYSKKGLKAVLTKQHGRFANADIYKDKKIVDRILLDTKTGKMRSIY